MAQHKTRILSKNDEIGLEKSLDLIHHFKQQGESGLIIPQDLARERKLVCQACGKPFDNLPKGRYFGEVFHKTCCEIMLQGGRP